MGFYDNNSQSGDFVFILNVSLPDADFAVLYLLVKMKGKEGITLQAGLFISN